jgi:MYXO-CTERM domain-containing protein
MRRVALACLFLAVPASAFDGAFRPSEGAPWDVEQGPVVFVLEPNGSDDIAGSADLDAVRAAFRAWECVAGTKLRFQEDEGPGPARVDLSDGKNTVFWDETNENGFGPGTLGVTVSDNSPGVPRQAADIVFNGFHHTWSTDDGPSATDVGSIAIHEIGHFLGLDHPCDKAPDGREFNCNGSERSIMTPAWDGAVGRAPLPDDVAGVRALYPADDDSTCDGPFRKGEPCTCDDECVDGLVCVRTGEGPKQVCAPRCAANNSDCGSGFACVLSPPEDEAPAAGVCVPHVAGQKPAGAVCVSNNECAEGRACALLFPVSRSLCQDACELDSDCPAGRCFEGFCLGGATNEQCRAPSPDGCACASSTMPGVALFLAALAFSRRRR